MTGSEIDVREGGELSPAGTLFGTDNPGEVVERASGVARTLAEVVRAQKLIVRIGQSDHVRVEGWTFLGSLLGVFPVVEWTRPLMEGEQQVGWEARVEARTKGGDVVGAAEAECLRSEKTWRGRDDYALRSMAQTRAVSKALRLPLGFVMQLAGFNPTPAEEMAVIQGEASRGSSGEPSGGIDAPVPRTDAASSVSQAPAQTGEPASPDGWFPPLPDEPPPEPATEAQKKKLNVLVGKLRPEHISTEQLWQAHFLDPANGLGEDGEVHWSPLRERLTFDQAHRLIERLSALQARVAKPAFEVPESARG